MAGVILFSKKENVHERKEGHCGDAKPTSSEGKNPKKYHR